MSALFRSDNAHEASTEVVGGKAFVLAELMQAGFKVPTFLVIAPEGFTDGRLSANIQEDVQAALSGLSGTGYAVRSSGRAEDGASDSHESAAQRLGATDCV